MKRIVLYLCINFAVLLTISLLTHIFGFDKWLTQEGIDYYQLLKCSAVWGFCGSFVSLLMSKMTAKMMVGARVITEPQTEEEQWLVKTVAELAEASHIRMPEVAVYTGSANAFATGAFKDDALVAVSTGLMRLMTRPQIRAVLAHEMSHVRNGDMVTMTLIQGVMNTFVFFFARIAALFLHSSRDENGRRRHSGGMGYYFTVRMFEFLFGILASIIAFSFSRHREYRADAGAAELLGDPVNMIGALYALKSTKIQSMPSEMRAFGIVDLPSSISELFSTHPTLDDRIKALQSMRGNPSGGVVRGKSKTGGVFGQISSDR